MERRGRFVRLLAILLSLPLLAAAVPAGAAAPALKFPVTFQTQLTPGTYTCTFTIWTARTGGAQVGNWSEPLVRLPVASNRTVYYVLGTKKALPALDLTQQYWVQLQTGSKKYRTRLPAAAYSFWGANADKLDGLDAAAFAPAAHDHTGDILIVMGPDKWFQSRTSPNALTLSRSYTAVQVVNSSTGYGYLIGIPELPVSMYGRALALSAIEFCYQASAQVSLAQFDAYVDTQASGIVTSYVNVATDPTDRTDAACRLYTFTPEVLSGEKIVNVKIHGNWSSPGALFSLGRATFVLQPTTHTVSPLGMPGSGSDESLLDSSLFPRDAP